MANHDSAKIIKPRALTVKQRKFVANKVKGMTGVAAAQEAYGASYSVANAIAGENLRKPSIQEAIEVEYEKQGISLAALIKPIADGLQAEKTVIIGKENDAFADQIPDHTTRLAAAKLGGMWLGIGRDKEEGSRTINFNITADTHKDQFNL